MVSKDVVEKYLEKLKIFIELSEKNDDAYVDTFRMDNSFAFSGVDAYVEFAYNVYAKTGIDVSDVTNKDILDVFYKLLDELININKEFYDLFSSNLANIIRNNDSSEDIFNKVIKRLGNNDLRFREPARQFRTAEKRAKEGLEKIIKLENAKVFECVKVIQEKVIYILDCFGKIDSLIEQENKRIQNSQLGSFLKKDEFMKQLKQKSPKEVETEIIFYINKLSKVLEEMRIVSFIFSENNYIANDKLELRKFKKSSKKQGEIYYRYKVIESFLSMATEFVRKRSLRRVFNFSRS